MTPSSQHTDASVFTWDDLPADSPMDKVSRRRIMGDRATVARIRLAKGFHLDTHSHENEQISVVLEGELRMGLHERSSPEYREVTLRAGQVIHLPSNLPHSAVALADTLVLDIFSPPAETTGIDRR